MGLSHLRRAKPEEKLGGRYPGRLPLTRGCPGLNVLSHLRCFRFARKGSEQKEGVKRLRRTTAAASCKDLLVPVRPWIALRLKRVHGDARGDADVLRFLQSMSPAGWAQPLLGLERFLSIGLPG